MYCSYKEISSILCCLWFPEVALVTIREILYRSVMLCFVLLVHTVPLNICNNGIHLLCDVTAFGLFVIIRPLQLLHWPIFVFIAYVYV
jgi:hypothetical protein